MNFEKGSAEFCLTGDSTDDLAVGASEEHSALAGTVVARGGDEKCDNPEMLYLYRNGCSNWVGWIHFYSWAESTCITL